MMKRIAVVLVTAMVLIGVGATAASASDGVCPPNKFCLWWDVFWHGPVYYYTPIPNYCYPVSAQWNDQASSYTNGTDLAVVVHVDAGCNNSPFFRRGIAAHTSVTEGYEFNDTTSSVQFKS